MKRFFCTICGRVKRVRKYPTDVMSVHSDNVSMRTGTCTRHYAEHEYQPVVKAKISDLTSLLAPRGKKRA